MLSSLPWKEALKFRWKMKEIPIDCLWKIPESEFPNLNCRKCLNDSIESKVTQNFNLKFNLKRRRRKIVWRNWNRTRPNSRIDSSSQRCHSCWKCQRSRCDISCWNANGNCTSDRSKHKIGGTNCEVKISSWKSEKFQRNSQKISIRKCLCWRSFKMAPTISCTRARSSWSWKSSKNSNQRNFDGISCPGK